MRTLKRIFYRFKYSILRIIPVQEKTDVYFRYMLLEPVFSDFTKFTVKLNGKEIWVENRYFASPVIMGEESLPYMDTTIEFFKAYDKAYLEHLKVKK